MTEVPIQFPYRPGMDPSHTEVGELIDMLDGALNLLASDNSPKAREWKTNFSRFLEGLYGNKRMLRQEVTRFAANAIATGGDAHQLVALEEEFHRFLLEYMDQLPLVRHIETMQIDVASPEEALAHAIYVLSLRAGAEMTSESWDEAPEDIKGILREVSAQLISAGFVGVDLQLTDETLEEVARKGAEEIFREAGFTEVPVEGEDVRLFTSGGALPPNIPMPPGFGPRLS